MISLIAAVDDDFGIGKNNRLLCHLPADLRHFKEITLGKPIIMGRNTFESIGRALPGRQNIVVSRTIAHQEGVCVVETLEKALQLAAGTNEVMVIGGGQIYQAALPYADRVYLTHIHHRFAADVFFPALDTDSWVCEGREFREKDSDNQYDMTFLRFVRQSVVNTRSNDFQFF